jgi:hypothetical protein
VDARGVLGLRFGRPGGGALLGALLAVQHVVARDLVLAGAHQRQLDLVLDVLDVHRAATGHVAGQRLHHLRGQRLHRLVDARAGGGIAAFHGQEGLGQGQLDLAGIEGRDLAVAADDLEAARGRGGHLGGTGFIGKAGARQVLVLGNIGGNGAGGGLHG